LYEKEIKINEKEEDKDRSKWYQKILLPSQCFVKCRKVKHSYYHNNIYYKKKAKFKNLFEMKNANYYTLVLSINLIINNFTATNFFEILPTKLFSKLP